ncbi:MAG: hypothetical protein Q8R60_14370 [Mycobacteriales bacterium]|nr:hypothetical protein [Mycobacteriales bacterium]
MRRLVAVGLLTGALLLPTAAWAHPLGNFTTNTADRLVVDGSGVAVTHVVDLAEIPTVQLRETADTDGSASLSDPEITAYAGTLCAQVLPQLELVVDGSPAPLRLESSSGRSLPGQAGLTTTRLECALRTDTRPARSLAFTDSSAADRTGWKEVTADTLCGEVVASDVPLESPSQLLLAYPEESLQSPPDVRTAAVSLASGPCRTGAAGDTAPDVAAPRGVDRLTAEFTAFVGRDDLGLLTGLGALALSVLFGCLHALAPGHGKTVMAAYLVGTRGTRRQALLLGAFVTVSHTASVLLLGLLINLGTLVAPERVVPATEVLSGVLLVAIGAWLLTGALRRLRGTPDHDHPAAVPAAGRGDHARSAPHGDRHIAHDHPHGDRDHPHDHPHEPVASASAGSGDHARSAPHGDHHIPHDHEPVAPASPGRGDHERSDPDSDHHIPQEPATGPVLVHSHGGRAHSHAPPPDRPLTWRSLATMGVASGIVPSPSVLVVLLGATALGRAPFGVLLVLGYGIGMAATLVAAGLLLLRAQGVAERRGWRLARTRRLGRLLPALTAGVVVLLGLALAVRGLGTARDVF